MVAFIKLLNFTNKISFMKRILFPTLFLVNFYISVQDTSHYHQKEFATAEGNKLPYRILYPENFEANNKYPLVLFMQSAGKIGNDNNPQFKN